MRPEKSKLLDGFLTREELASELGKSVRTIDRWHADGVGPPRVTLGNAVLYRVESVRRWIVEQERQEPQPA
jgi:predicted DNA-binding transcriptional regulator AlpA